MPDRPALVACPICFEKHPPGQACTRCSTGKVQMCTRCNEKEATRMYFVFGSPPEFLCDDCQIVEDCPQCGVLQREVERLVQQNRGLRAELGE